MSEWKREVELTRTHIHGHFLIVELRSIGSLEVGCKELDASSVSYSEELWRTEWMGRWTVTHLGLGLSIPDHRHTCGIVDED